jgi:hypothetical protein
VITGRDPAPVETANARIQRHVDAEFTSNPELIMSTVSRDPFFPILIRGVPFGVLTGRDSVHEYYVERLRGFEIIDTTRVYEHRTDWYGMNESIATVRHVGTYQGVPGDGSTYRVHSAVLFPVDEDGIVGELEWTHFDFVDIFKGTAALPPLPAGTDAHLPLRRLENVRRHQRLFDALAHADFDAAVVEVGDDCCWASRFALAGADMPGGLPGHVQARGNHEAIRRAVSSAWMPLRGSDVQVLHRYATEWFVCSEHALHLPSGATLRMASMSPVAEDGRFLAHLSYTVSTA